MKISSYLPLALNAALWCLTAQTGVLAAPVSSTGSDANAIHATASDLSLPAKKEIAMQIVASAENSSLDWRAQYGYIQDIHDGRGYTGGIIGFCSGTGDMLEVIRHYTQLSPTNILAKYLPALEKLDGDDSHEGLEPDFVKDWKTAAADPLFQKSQDWENDRVYFNPAVKQARADGLRALGQFIYYDAIVMHGPGDSNDSLGGIRREALRIAKTPAQGGDEVAYLNAFLDARKAAMRSEEAHSNTSRIDTAQRVFLQNGNLDLDLPLSWKVYGGKFSIEEPPAAANAAPEPAAQSSTDANGSEAFINQGIETKTGGKEKAGWNPPLLRMEDLHTISLDAFCRIFAPAAKYRPFFKAAGEKYRLNPTLLAAIAMEESHCDPTVSDGGNAANAGGIMQIQGQDTPGSADPAANIMQGAHELRRHLDETKGSLLEAIGNYNGWQRGLTVKTMIHPPWGGASMNLDYVYQIVNGWCLGVDGYTIGSFNRKYNPSFGDQFR